MDNNDNIIEFKPLSSYSITKLVDELNSRRDFDVQDYFDFEEDDDKKLLEDFTENELVEELKDRDEYYDYILSGEQDEILVDKDDLTTLEKQEFIKKFFDLKCYDNVESVISEVRNLFQY